MYFTAVSPNKRSLGATYGLALNLESIGRIIMSPMAKSTCCLNTTPNLVGIWYIRYVHLSRHWGNWPSF